MEGQQYTTTGQFENTVIRFERPVPPSTEITHTVPAQGAAERQVYSAAEYAALEEKVGELTAQLAEVRTLQASGAPHQENISHSATVVHNGSAVGVLATESTAEALRQREVVSDTSMSEEHATTNGHQEKAEAIVPSIAVPELSGEEQEGLSDAQVRYAKTILFLLDQPNQKYESPNASTCVREILGIGEKEWRSLLAALGTQYGIIKLHKVAPNARRSTGVEINVAALKTNTHRRFYIPRITAKLRELDGSDNQATVDTPHTPSKNGSHVAEQQEKPVVSANNGSHKVSARVRKAMKLEPGSVPGYREEVPMEPFLTHHRTRPGAKGRRTQY